MNRDESANIVPFPADTGLAGGPSGPHDGGMEARVAKLEASLAHVEADVTEIKTDLRELRHDLNGKFLWLLSAGVGATLLLLATLGTGFLYIIDRLPVS